MKKLTDDIRITSLAYEDVIPTLAKRYMLTIEEATEVVKDLSFSEYKELLEQNAGPSLSTAKPGSYPAQKEVSNTQSPSTELHKEKAENLKAEKERNWRVKKAEKADATTTITQDDDDESDQERAEIGMAKANQLRPEIKPKELPRQVGDDKQVPKQTTPGYQIESVDEDITSPSEQTPGQSQIGTSSTTSSGGAKTSIPWPGKVPIQQGMEVGLQDKQTGLIMPYNVARIDKSTKGVTGTDPKTGQQQTYNEKDFVPMPAKGSSPVGQTQQKAAGPMPQTQTAVTGLMQSYDYEKRKLIRLQELDVSKDKIKTNKQFDINDILPQKEPKKVTKKEPEKDTTLMPKTRAALGKLMQSTDYDDRELMRLRELAGIKESGSGGVGGAGAIAGGSTMAGNIASVAKPLGDKKKKTEMISRQPKHEEIHTSDPKRDVSIHGKIDPRAATGELSRTLADRNIKTASRKNNGKKTI